MVMQMLLGRGHVLDGHGPPAALKFHELIDPDPAHGGSRLEYWNVGIAE
jgi:hypothetical protein